LIAGGASAGSSRSTSSGDAIPDAGSADRFGSVDRVVRKADLMKTERRHELKENDLAHLLEQARVYLGEHGKQVAVAVIAVVGVVVLVSVFLRSRAASIEDVWRQRAELKLDTIDEARTSLKTLRTLAVNAPDRTFTLSGLMECGASGLRFARQQPKGIPDQEMNDFARESYSELLKRFSNNPLAFGTAHCGLATVEENAFVLDGNAARKDAARKHLQAVVERTDLNLTPFYRMANDRLAALDQTFHRVEFAPAPPPVDPALPEGVKVIDSNSPQPVELVPLPGPPPGLEHLNFPPPVPVPQPAPPTPTDEGSGKVEPEQPVADENAEPQGSP
jgi:hypothetical protein